MNQTNIAPKKQTIILKNREELFLDGVSDVIGFDECSVTVKTVLGGLTVDGTDLHITRMSLESGEVVISGNVSGLFYDETKGTEKPRFFSRLWK